MLNNLSTVATLIRKKSYKKLIKQRFWNSMHHFSELIQWGSPSLLLPVKVQPKKGSKFFHNRVFPLLLRHD